MLGFLRGFVPRSFLVKQDDWQCLRSASVKAVEFGMLGMPDEAHALFAAVREHPSYSESSHRGTSTAKKFFLHATGEAPMTKEELREVQLKAVQNNSTHVKLPSHIDWANVTAKDYQRLSDWTAALGRSSAAMATSGFDAMKMSQALLGLCYMADTLGRSESVQALLKHMTRRIHANQQSSYVAMLAVAWPDYLLSGYLRSGLGVSRTQLQDYASVVLETVRSRLENGPLHPDMYYREYTMQELLALLDKQTQEAPVDDVHDEELQSESERAEQVAASIVLPGATDTEIEETEQRLLRPLPQDLKEFYRLSNGTLATSEAGLPGSRKRKLVPLHCMGMEQEGYMDDYTFSVLPKLNLREFGVAGDANKFWGGISAAGIAMYDQDGQGTEYAWIFDKEFVDQSKQRLQGLYVKSNTDQKARIDKAIVDVYGTRATYDEMQYCVYVQEWGEPTSTMFPSFRSYLCHIVYNSKVEDDPSPLRSTGVDN